MRRPFGAADQRQIRHRRDRRQRLAAEAHGRHLFQLFERGDLAGGVAFQRHWQLVAGDADTVVLDHHRPHAARAQPHCDVQGAGVERVVDQLAHHRRGALHHFTCCDLADQVAGQLADGSTRCAIEGGLHGERLYGEARPQLSG
jgi:hypothetical protein